MALYRCTSKDTMKIDRWRAGGYSDTSGTVRSYLNLDVSKFSTLSIESLQKVGSGAVNTIWCPITGQPSGNYLHVFNDVTNNPTNIDISQETSIEMTLYCKVSNPSDFSGLVMNNIELS